MKNGDLFELKEVIKSIKDLGNINFKLAIMINEEILESRINIILKQNEPSSEFNEYTKKLRELQANYAEKDDDGALMLYEGQNGSGRRITKENESGFYNIINDIDKFNEDKHKLDLEYKDVIDNYNTKYLAFLELLKEDINDIHFIKFNTDILPNMDYDKLKKLKPILNL